MNKKYLIKKLLTVINNESFFNTHLVLLLEI